MDAPAKDPTNRRTGPTRLSTIGEGCGNGETLAPERGFTLIELLVVIMVLGVLATIVTFAVRGVVDRGDEGAVAADSHTIETAEESHMALHGVYTDEAGLVQAGFLREASGLHDVNVFSDQMDYQIIDQGAGGPPAWEVPPGQTVESFGGGAKKLVILGVGQGTNAWWDSIKAGAPLADTQVIWVNGPQSVASVEAIFASNPTYVIVPVAVPISGAPQSYVGQYLDSVRSSPGQFWWGHGQQLAGQPVAASLDYYVNPARSWNQ